MPPTKRKASASSNPGLSGTKRRSRGHVGSTVSHEPSVGLSMLPEEIILEILDFFLTAAFSKGQIDALYNLCLTSRQFYRLSKSYLYNYVDNRLIEPRKLLRTLVQEPHMAKRVRNLQWFDDHGNAASCCRVHDKNYALTHTERRELCKKVDELGLMAPRAYARAFQLQRPKDHLAALLLLCPDIRNLDVCDTNVCCYPRGYHATPPWLRILGSVGLGDKKVHAEHFKNLSAIRIRLGPIQLISIPPILNIPSLRSLMLEDVYQPNSDMDGLYPRAWACCVKPRTSPLKNLYVENSYIDTKSLTLLIPSVRALRLFCFEFDHSVRNSSYTLYDDEFPELHYPSLATALLEHKESLEQICISDIADPELNILFNMDQGHLGSLREMQKVRIVDVDLACFGTMQSDFDEDAYGFHLTPTTDRPANLADNLPASLERLDLTLAEKGESSYERFWVHCLDELAKSMKTNLPALKEICLSRKDLSDVWPVEWDKSPDAVELQRVRKLFADAGVRLAASTLWDCDDLVEVEEQYAERRSFSSHVLDTLATNMTLVP